LQSDRVSTATTPAAPTPDAAAAGGAIDDGDRQKAKQLKAFVSDANMKLSTYHDEASGRDILEVRDQATGELVTQYPSEELIRLYAALRQSLVDESA
jgi:uncharacterized FlaG/YvyC family protein